MGFTVLFMLSLHPVYSEPLSDVRQLDHAKMNFTLRAVNGLRRNLKKKVKIYKVIINYHSEPVGTKSQPECKICNIS